jgi:hypothetical protein
VVLCIRGNAFGQETRAELSHESHVEIDTKSYRRSFNRWNKRPSSLPLPPRRLSTSLPIEIEVMSGLSRFTAVLSFKEVLPRRQRGYATSSTTTPFQVFNTDIKRRQRNRSATLDPETSRRTDYLRDEVATRLIERFMVLVLRNEVDFSSSIVDFVPSWTMEQGPDTLQKP